jgi:hypothetical protein
MKTYNVELRHLAYVNLTIEADSPEQAEALAWAQVESGEVGDPDGDWTLSDMYELPYEQEWIDWGLVGDQPSREG